MSIWIATPKNILVNLDHVVSIETFGEYKPNGALVYFLFASTSDSVSRIPISSEMPEEQAAALFLALSYLLNERSDALIRMKWLEEGLTTNEADEATTAEAAS